MVSRAQFTASPLRSVAPVVCTVCGSNAHCIRRVPDSNGRRIEYRAFDCAVCHRRSYLNVSLAPSGNVVSAPNASVPNPDEIEKEVERLIRRAKPQPNPNPEP